MADFYLVPRGTVYVIKCVILPQINYFLIKMDKSLSDKKFMSFRINLQMVIHLMHFGISQKEEIKFFDPLHAPPPQPPTTRLSRAQTFTGYWFCAVFNMDWSECMKRHTRIAEDGEKSIRHPSKHEFHLWWGDNGHNPEIAANLIFHLLDQTLPTIPAQRRNFFPQESLKPMYSFGK